MGCQAGTPPSCDDGIGCTTDACDTTLDACTHTPVDTACNDNVFCNGAETCSATLGCQPGTPPSCDDGISCTADFCDQTNDQCAHVPTDTKCSDGLFCNGSEVCDPPNGAPLTGCRAGAPPNCDDGVACTTDACSEATKSCTHTPVNAMCDDNVFCNGQETCDVVAGCLAGTPVDCEDGLSCTADSCSEAQKKCVHTPVNAACDDGLYCNGVETCSPTGPAPTGCLAGTPPACPPDSIACTVDACDEATKSCKHTPSNALCPPGQFCVTAQGGCTTGTPCSNDAQCQDGNLCNGVETCTLGICKPGTPVDCNDGIGCTVDSCNPATGVCAHTPNDAFCNDGLVCNGAETCSAQSGCVAGTPVNCDDGIACTIDDCNEPNGACTHQPDDSLCSHGKLCNGIETCDVVKGCQPAAAPFVCPSTGVACAPAVCDPVLNACKPIPDDSKCPCGQTCSATLGCGNFCQVKTCQGKVYQCGDCLDNDGDCKIDAADSMCLGPCDNTEDSFYGGIPGQNNAPCKQDCYFDADSGSGNDDCYWDHQCDPYEVAPNYPPEGLQCKFDPTTKVTSTLTCSQANASQSQTCHDYCGPLTPNGCDCFGCCSIPGAPTTVWLGSENPKGTGSCNLNTLNDPTKCKPCTQVQACLNTCEHCELCVGKTTLPPDCVSQTCPGNTQPCGLPGQAACPSGYTCITGCCQANPQ
jgi:hypothetical protein